MSTQNHVAFPGAKVYQLTSTDSKDHGKILGYADNKAELKVLRDAQYRTKNPNHKNADVIAADQGSRKSKSAEHIFTAKVGKGPDHPLYVR